MIANPFVQLLWKEYRAARAFWLALVGLVVVVQGLLLWLSQDVAWSMRTVCNIALAAPAFFALGCTGAAFAVEQEEGTFDFLQAAPVSARQILAGKWVLAGVATLAMFVVLWPVALLLTGGARPDGKMLEGMLGLWVLAALEAAAWGTLFSLLSARPLVAISLALVTTSTLVHLTAWSTLAPGEQDFSFTPYLDAVPLRSLIVAAVLAVDVYLGLRWVRGGPPRVRWASPAAPAERADEQAHAAATSRQAAVLAARPDRTAMLGRLFWLEWRQATWLILLMVLLQVGTFLVVLASAYEDENSLLPLAAVAALAGACVFLADQERRRHRFFVEHNVPPRLVWMVRQLPWIVAMSISTAICLLAWVNTETIAELRQLIASATNTETLWQPRWQPVYYIALPPLLLAAAFAAVSYAAGQWTSMMVRSGLLAGFFGILMAGALCGWVFLMFLLKVSWLWSVVPIPLVLLWATWLRAPDWVRENTTWSARLRAAAAVLVPVAVLLVALPVARVQSVPLQDPGFDVADFRARITPEALKTGEMYRRAGELLVAPAVYQPDREFTPRQSKLLKQNAEALALVLEASRRPTCCLGDPSKINDLPELLRGFDLILLVLASGRQLQVEGQLDEALDRYFSALDVISHFTESVPSYRPRRLADANVVFDALVNWSAAPGQTDERIHAALKGLEAVDWQILHLADGLKADYILAQRFAAGDQEAWTPLFGAEPNEEAVAQWHFTHRALPWEKYRDLRELNIEMSYSLQMLNVLEKQLRRGHGIGNDPGLTLYRSYEERFPPFAAAPQLAVLADDADKELALFEAIRRAALLRMALVAYRLEHGALPAALGDLVREGYFKQLPHDPYSGLDYAYFPEGLPPPSTKNDAELVARMTDRLIPGVPCLWCTGEQLDSVTVERADGEDEAAREPLVRYRDRLYLPTFREPDFGTWSMGHWFPIPNRE